MQDDKSLMIINRFIIGFKNRNKPKCPENIDVSDNVWSIVFTIRSLLLYTLYNTQCVLYTIT